MATDQRVEQSLAEYVIDTLEQVVEMTGGLDKAGATVVLKGLREAWAERDRMRSVLTTLEQWDMLTLDGEGHGVATADAPWARELIAKALRG